MSNLPIFSILNLDDDHTDVPQKVNMGGHAVYVVDASSEAALVNLGWVVNGRENGPLILQDRDWIKSPEAFNQLNVYHAAQSGEWVKLMMVAMSEPPADFEYSRAGRSVVDAIANAIKVTGGTQCTHTAVALGAAAVKVLDADATRTSACIYVPRSFAGVLYGGADATVDDTGAPIGEGGCFIIHATQDALYLVTDGSSVTVGVREDG